MDIIEKWVMGLLKDLRLKRFYGKIVFEMKFGKIVLVRKEETLKPPTSDANTG
ncbi:hypothetical protein LCGC14_0232010 [marine sediment metagenome]|uniref:Uncharacterized protein n=1 Tax=marine sediment metagenome TaxID=412755 RepID=A0A0F9XE80_9ZZZZ